MGAADAAELDGEDVGGIGGQHGLPIDGRQLQRPGVAGGLLQVADQDRAELPEIALALGNHPPGGLAERPTRGDHGRERGSIGRQVEIELEPFRHRRGEEPAHGRGVAGGEVDRAETDPGLLGRSGRSRRSAGRRRRGSADGVSWPSGAGGGRLGGAADSGGDRGERDLLDVIRGDEQAQIGGLGRDRVLGPAQELVLTRIRRQAELGRLATDAFEHPAVFGSDGAPLWRLVAAGIRPQPGEGEGHAQVLADTHGREALLALLEQECLGAEEIAGGDAAPVALGGEIGEQFLHLPGDVGLADAGQMHGLGYRRAGLTQPGLAQLRAQPGLGLIRSQGARGRRRGPARAGADGAPSSASGAPPAARRARCR